MTKSYIKKQINNNDETITLHEITKLELILQKYINDPVKRNIIVSEYKSTVDISNK
jgi:hypothetical protein